MVPLQIFVRQQRCHLAQVVAGIELAVDGDRGATTGPPDHLQRFKEYIQQTAKIGSGELQSCFTHSANTSQSCITLSSRPSFSGSTCISVT